MIFNLIDIKILFILECSTSDYFYDGILYHFNLYYVI